MLTKTSKSTASSSRRSFLATLGASAALSPFVPFLNRQAEAQQAPPRRLMILFTPNGSVPARYWPDGGETDFTFAPGSITEALAPFKAKMIFTKGLSRPRGGGGGHESAFRTQWTGCGQTGSGGGFGGYAAGPSVDQIIAKALPPGPTFPSLQFGVQHDGPGANPSVLTVMTYAAAGQPLAPESNPYKMFDRLMLGGGGTPGTLTADQLAKVRARRKSVIDLVSEDLRALSPKLDRGDRTKLNQHLEALSSIEKRLDKPANPMDSKKCGGPNIRPMIDLAANESFPELLGIQSSLGVAALACDLTRVTSMQWSRSFSQVRHTWVGVSSEHHTLSHMTAANDMQQKYLIDRWYHQRIAELLKQMDSIPEGNGTLLDNTMVLFCNDLSEGAAHSVSPAIAWVAGSGGGKLKTGRFLQLGSYDFTQLMVTAAHVMGVTSVDKVGTMGKAGDIPGLLA
jgi:hypothetical protein